MTPWRWRRTRPTVQRPASGYEDLRHNQRRRCSRSGCGHSGDGKRHCAYINKRDVPVALYTDSLLEGRLGSRTGPGSAETIQRAIHDVAATVARMREFYRQREPQVHASVQLNDLVPQVELTSARWRTCRRSVASR